MKVIELKDVKKSYGKNEILHGISLDIEEGSIHGLVGRNGCGKTTMMKMIMGIEEPDEGQVILGPTVKLGYFSQENESLDPSQRVIDYIRDTAEYVKTEDGMAAASVMLERFLFDATLQYSLIGKLSGGEKRRLYLLKVLMEAPNILILDEPTNGLDPAGIQEMRSLISSMPETTGATVLISSHLLGEIEQMVTQVGILNHGKMLFEGSLQALQKHSRGGILLRVLDVPKSIAVLNRQGIRAVTQAQHPDVLELPALPDEALAALVSTLAENGVGVVGLTAQTKNLEEIFLSLTQNNGEVA